MDPTLKTQYPIEIRIVKLIDYLTKKNFTDVERVVVTDKNNEK